MSPRYLPFVLLCLAGVLGAEPKRDPYGDPLPEGAIARLGSLRFRHGSRVEVVGFSQDGKVLATFDGGDSLARWDTASGRKLRPLPVGYVSQPIYHRFSTDGKWLILADRTSEFRVLDAVTGAVRLKLEPQKLDRRYLDVQALAISQDGKTAVIGHDWFIREIHFFPDSKRLVSNTSGDMIVWDVATSQPVASYRSGRLQQ